MLILNNIFFLATRLNITDVVKWDGVTHRMTVVNHSKYFLLQNNSQLFVVLNYSHFLSCRPYSPAIPRIPCVSPETVLLDQVGLTSRGCITFCKQLCLYPIEDRLNCESQNVFWCLFLSRPLIFSVSSIRLSPFFLVSSLSSLPPFIELYLFYHLLLSVLFSVYLFSVIPSYISPS